ncbi:carbohydrate-binding module family 50 protein [Macrolepiota fuliginosa MF-IS2]|uniref:Carbohydrate-binding module family 50 protein n=1 Tax=Macrolepiota fuliginosa MF-IS2 TaxID=1400762 RepID=A0A9P5XCA5_9AGAR|nr:carbohydrate-binding module family 50 protein [Macrolepiota fuliginosa MF-IS2]
MFTSTLFAIVCAAMVSVHSMPQSQPPGPACPAGEQLYTVQMGDSCFTIGGQFGTSATNIIAVNQPAINSGCTNLTPGQMICVPASTGATGGTTGGATGGTTGGTTGV